MTWGERGIIENVEASIRADEQTISIQPSSFSFAGGKINLEGSAQQYREIPALNLKASATEISLGHLPIPNREGAPRILGLMSGAVRIRAAGKTRLEIQKTLSGDGNVTVRDGVIQNVNLLQEVFGRLSMIPGLVERLLQRLPPEYQQKLSERDTRLRPIDQTFTVESGAAQINRLALATENLGLSGDAVLGLDGSVSAQTMLVIDSTLSGAAIASVRELQYLTDSKGQINLPVRFQGALDRLVIQPDLQYVTSRLAVTKATEVLGNVLQQTMGRKSDSTGSTSTKMPKGSTILAGILGSVLQAEQGSSSSGTADAQPQN